MRGDEEGGGGEEEEEGAKEAGEAGGEYRIQSSEFGMGSVADWGMPIADWGVGCGGCADALVGEVGKGDGRRGCRHHLLSGRRGDGGVVEEVLGGEAGDDGVFAVGEFGEAVQAELDVVLGLDLELLRDEGGFEVGVVLILGGGEEVFGLVLSEVGGVEEVIEFGALAGG